MNARLRLLTIMVISFLGSACSGRGPLVSNHGYPIASGTRHSMSWKEVNESTVIMQDRDYSCGAASLATLMQYYFDDPVTENDILEMITTLFTVEQQDVIKNQGLSFHELEIIANARGYLSSSVELEAETVKQIKGPILVYIEPYGYPHFAVFRGVYEDRAFLADPSRGNIRMSFQKFKQEWSGKALVLGKEGFGVPATYPLAIADHPGIGHELRTARPTNP